MDVLCLKLFQKHLKFNIVQKFTLPASEQHNDFIYNRVYICKLATQSFNTNSRTFDGYCQYGKHI